jgi:hypothetical protein
MKPIELRDALHRFKDQLDRDSGRQSGNVRDAFYRAAIEMVALLAGTLPFIGVPGIYRAQRIPGLRPRDARHAQP